MVFIQMLYHSAVLWMERDMSYYAAAFSYYAPLALIPLVLLSIVVSGFFYGAEVVKNIFNSWGSVFGSDVLNLITSAVANLETKTNTFQAPVIAIVFFIILSFFTLNVLAKGFGRVWNVEPSGITSIILQFFRSALFVLIIQVYIIGLIGFTGGASMIVLPSFGLLPLMFSFFSIVTFFTLLFKFLVRGAPSWRGSIVGGIVAGMLFLLARIGVTMYLAHEPAESIFGAAGLMLVLLIWIYVISCIIFYGAVVADQYDKMVLRAKV